MDQIRRDCDELRKMDPLDAMQRVFGAMKDGGGSSLAILALDKGIAEVIRLRNAVTFADQQGAEAIERVSSAIIADKWSATATFQERALKAEAERDELRLVLATERVGSDPWFVVHQRDGRPRVEVFSGDGAEHAAKMRARDHATNWSEVYIMRGVEVHGGDFEDEAMKDRADRG